MAYLTYPLNNIDYNAEDAEAYLCTRRSGVYSQSDFVIAPASGSNKIQVGKGIAWIKNHEFAGKVFKSDSTVTITLPAPPDSGTRVDNIVIQFSKTKNATTITCRSGGVGEGAPAPVRNDDIYELVIGYVNRTAKQSTISAGNIVDTRFDSVYCGLMQDGAGTRALLPSEMPKKYVLVGDSYTDPTLTGDGAYTTINAFKDCGINFSQVYSQSGSGFYDGTWNRAMEGFTADNEVTDIVILSGLNDYAHICDGTATIDGTKTNLLKFVNDMIIKFPNARAHFYFCGVCIDDSNVGMRKAKYDYYTMLLTCEGAPFEVVRGSWTCLTTRNDFHLEKSDNWHPNLQGMIRFVSLVASSIANGFAPIERHEYKEIFLANWGNATGAGNFWGYQTIDGETLSTYISYYQNANFNHEFTYEHNGLTYASPINLGDIGEPLTSGSEACSYSATTSVWVKKNDNSLILIPATIYLVGNTLFLRHSMTVSGTIKEVILNEPIKLTDSAFSAHCIQTKPHWS